MKNILVIDTIIDDKSMSQTTHLKRILGPRDTAFEFREVHPASGGTVPQDLADANAVIFSGSMHSAYEDFVWKRDLHLIFEAVLNSGLPALAICFGAQFLAYHLGSSIAENPRGVEFGPAKIQLTGDGANNKLFADHQDKYVFASHGDIIEKLPVGATLLAYNDNSPIQAYQYGPILASQFHCDVPLDCARELLDKRKNKYLQQGVLRDEAHYLALRDQLDLIEQSHDFLRNFLTSI